jgi:sugar/nucleoside kinase (ribokinase family)
MPMQALFIGQTYIDITFLTDRLPTGDEKHVASEYAVSFGGNAVTAAFCCAKLSIVPDLLTSVAEDWLGRMFLDMATKHEVPIHPRKVTTSSLSFIMPREGKRAIVRCRDDDHLGPFPTLDLTGCRALHSMAINPMPLFIMRRPAELLEFSHPWTGVDFGQTHTIC